PGFLQRGGWNLADGSEKVRRSHRLPGRRPEQSFHHGIAGAGLLPDQPVRQTGRGRGQATGHQCSHNGTGSGSTCRAFAATGNVSNRLSSNLTLVYTGERQREGKNLSAGVRL